MTNLHNGVSFSDESPKFFKVFIPKFNEKQMLLPPAFVMKFIPKPPENTVITDSRGESWAISMVIRDNKVCFETGWEDFAKEQSLEFGDFLLFTYSTTNQVFGVEIFGKNGCKKESKAVPKAVHWRGKIEAEESESEEICGNGSTTKQGSSEEIRVRTRDDKSVKLTSPTNLNFTVTIYNESSMIYCAHIPEPVFKNIKFKPEVLLRGQNCKLWPVKIVRRVDGRGAIQNGWKIFQNDNNLRSNDKCLLEPVLGQGNVCEEIKVQIIRGSEKT